MKHWIKNSKNILIHEQEDGMYIFNIDKGILIYKDSSEAKEIHISSLSEELYKELQEYHYV